MKENKMQHSIRLFVAACLAGVIGFTASAATVEPSAFEAKIAYTISGYAGSSTVTDLPVLVRLSVNSPKGFSYARCPQDSIRFADAVGNLLAHEIDTWNPAGESTIWVKVPSVSGTTTAFTLYYGGRGAETTARAATEVWSNYAAVFHGGTKAFANAVGNAVEGSAGDAKVVVQNAACKVGGGIYKPTCNIKAFNFTNPVKAGALASVKNMTLSGWFRPNGFKNDSSTRNTGILACSRGAWDDANNKNGFALMCEAGTWLSLSVGAAHNPSNTTTMPGTQKAFAWAKDEWNHYAFTYRTEDETETYTTYCNGALCSSGTPGNKLEESEKNEYWSFGGLANAPKVDNFRGDMDELRVMNGAASADYLAAEVAAMRDGFLTASAVKPLSETYPVLGEITSTYAGGGLATITVEVTSGTGEVYVLVNGEMAEKVLLGTIDPAAGYPQTISGDLPHDEDGFLTYAIYAVNDLGEATIDRSPAPFVKPLAISDFRKKFTVTMPETLTETLTDFPLLVRLDPAAITNFSYDEIYQDGKDIAALDANGQILPVEVVWNPEGVSLLWVKVPEMTGGTEVTIAYGTRLPTDSLPAASETWSDYAGVWHMDETEGTAVADSSAVKDGVASGSATVVDGVLGKGRSRGTTTGTKGPCVLVDRTDKLDDLDSTFTVSGWVKFNTAANWGYFFGRKSSDSYQSWGVQCSGSGGDGNALRLWSNGTADNDNNRAVLSTSGVFPQGTWKKYMFVYTESTITLYVDGVQVGDPQAVKPGAAVKGSLGFAIGGLTTTTNHGTLPADHDEVKLRKGAVNATWAAVEYAQECAAYGTYSAARPMDASAPVFGTVDATVTEDGTVTVAVEVLDGSGGIAFVYNGDKEHAVSLGELSDPPTMLTDHPAIPAEAIWSVTALGTSPSGTTVDKSMSSGVMNARVGVAKTADAEEDGLCPGVVTLSRPASATELPLVVNLGWSGTAVAGVDFADDLPEQVTIPAGETSAQVAVTPLLNGVSQASPTVVLTVLPGPYIAGETAEVVIRNLETNPDFNTWVATAPGKASVDANWSAGHAPRADEKVMFDGRFSTAACEWDADATQTVAAWKQAEGYTATVTFNTEFPTYASATFPLFTITGDCEILTGGWTCRGNYNNYGAANPSNTSKLASKRWCLNVSVGGKLTLASGATIDLTGKGFGHPGNQSSPSYGGYGFMAPETMAPYGSLTEPFDPGMGCRSQGDQNGRISGIGGGAVKLVVTGDLELGGAIRAVGTIDNNVVRSGGTGGSIWIDARQITGEGTIDASGCPPSSFTSDQGVAVGSGGRIALYTKEPLALGRAKISCSGAAYAGTSNGSKTKIGSAGTIYIKDATQANGRLVLKQSASVASANAVGSVVPLMGDVTLDGIELSGRVVLAVREGEKLTLPNGFASVTSAETTVGACGIALAGGTIDAGAGDQTITGWTLEPVSGFTFPANASLANAGGVGLLKRNVAGTGDAPLMPRSVSFTVAGDFAIDATSAVDVGNAIGYVNYETAKKAGWHGGWTTYFDGSGNAADGRTKTYGSVFNPVAVGSSPSRAYLTGGAVDMTVGGTLTLLGKITASGPFSDSSSDNVAPSSGGSVKVTADAIAGTGSIGSCGGAGRRNYAGGGAGGRIAITLTKAGATIPETITLNAQGRYGYAFNASANKLGSAGTIYVETKAEGEKGGTIIVSNWKDHANADFTSATVIPTTPIVAAQDGDAVADFKKAKLVICNNAIAEVSAEDLRLKAVTVDAGSSLELAGRTLTVAKATLGSAKLKPGTYKASDAGLVGFVTDSSSGATGSLVVTGGGIVIVVR